MQGGNIIEDSDGSIKYTGNWTLVPFLSTKGNTTRTQTFHTTLDKGAAAELDFSGKSIAVFGAIPANNGSEPQPSVDYYIDSQGPFSVTLPHSNQLVTGQMIFTSPPLQNGPHSMKVVVTSNNANFTLDFIKTDVTPGPQLSTSGTADVTSGRTSQRTATIVGVVLGTILLLMLFLLAFAMLRRRRRIMFVQHFPEPSMDEKPGSGPIERDMQRETRATWTTTVERPTDSGAFGDNLVVDFRYSPRSSHLSDPISPAFAVPRPRAPAGSSEEKSRWSPVSSTFSRAHVPQSATAALPPPFTASDPRNTVSSEKHASWIPIGLA
ncbi:hypothetical protein BD410DRAFT_193852 [Rickenella mellea]|uniref:Uncharacterized protein n=1 Tax=Rickenella mellea TaxID=50990 RepID=A0A4Y7Q5L6_9AGAM|nr:hypothetical protein BD410DRAFT_193852 [Rickenella mellea]